jgi:hypothetical protein
MNSWCYWKAIDEWDFLDMLFLIFEHKVVGGDIGFWVIFIIENELKI